MANTFSQVSIHLVFSVKSREYRIVGSIKERLLTYISAIIKGEGQHPIRINSMPDHIHILVSMNCTMPISDLVRKIKSQSTNFIKSNRLVPNFAWQTGYGAFSVSKNNVGSVISYIDNQEMHHKVRSFKEEYIEFLNEQGISFDLRYVFNL